MSRLLQGPLERTSSWSSWQAPRRGTSLRRMPSGPKPLTTRKVPAWHSRYPDADPDLSPGTLTLTLTLRGSPSDAHPCASGSLQIPAADAHQRGSDPPASAGRPSVSAVAVSWSRVRQKVLAQWHGHACRCTSTGSCATARRWRTSGTRSRPSPRMTCAHGPAHSPCPCCLRDAIA